MTEERRKDIAYKLIQACDGITELQLSWTTKEERKHLVEAYKSLSDILFKLGYTLND